MHARGLPSVANILISMPDAKRMQVGSRLPMKRIAAAILLLSTPATHATTLWPGYTGTRTGRALVVARDRRQALLVQTARPNAAEVGAQVADETEGAARRVLLGGFRRQMLEPRLWALAHRSAARRSSVRPHPMSVNAAISYSVARKRGSAWQRDGRPRGRLLTTSLWPAPGSEDTELGALMELEVGHGETEVYPRVQA
jgi:hypothetical protein